MRSSSPTRLSCQGSRRLWRSPLYEKTLPTSNTRLKTGMRTQSKNEFQRFQLFYSTDAAATVGNNFLVEIMVKSVGFSKQKAICTSAKVARLKPGNNKPLLVLNFFQQIGLDKTQIKLLISGTPSLLFSDVDKTIKPKIKVLQELGLSGSDLAKVLSRSGPFLMTSLDNFIRPNLNYFRKVLGSNESMTNMIKRNPQLLRYNGPKSMSPKIAFLQNVGLSGKCIENLIGSSVLLRRNTEWLEDAVHQVEQYLHIARHSPMFAYGIMAISYLGKSTLETKLETFRRFGWSDLEILTILQKNPLCLSLSEARLGKALNFFMEELGYEAGYLACRPNLLSTSLEKRVKPRHEILKLLYQKKLTKCSLITVVSFTESKFLTNYVLPFTDEIPELYELYMKSRRQ